MTGLEPATSGVTGRCSNQLSYIPKAYQLTTCDKFGTLINRPHFARFLTDIWTSLTTLIASRFNLIGHGLQHQVLIWIAFRKLSPAKRSRLSQT